MNPNSKDRIKKINAIDELVKRVGSYSTGAELAGLFQFIRKFPHMSPYNMMLIHIQKPGSRFVARADEWQSLYQRTIKPGARPLLILWPFGPVDFVFELGDTEGKDFPEELLRPFKAEGRISHAVLSRLLRNLERYGIAYYEADHGTNAAGSIGPAKKKGFVPVTVGKRLIYVKTCYSMVVNRNLEPVEKCATIAHELGHLFCGHLGRPSADVEDWPDRRGLPRNTKEFEAECVAWLVCERLGIYNPSERYLAGYLNIGPDGRRKEPPPFSIESVLKATGMVEDMLQKSQQPPKRLLKSPQERGRNPPGPREQLSLFNMTSPQKPQ